MVITGEHNVEPEEQIEDHPDRYLRFPSKYEIHDYRIMKQFIYTLPKSIEREELSSSIRGKGAFRKFKSTVRYYGLEQQWYAFKEETLQQIAVDWYRKNHLTPDDTEN